jgi:hypothetical protein
MSVCCECCVLSGRGLCNELVPRPEESYRVWCVWVWSWSLEIGGGLGPQGAVEPLKKKSAFLHFHLRTVSEKLLRAPNKVSWTKSCNPKYEDVVNLKTSFFSPDVHHLTSGHIEDSSRRYIRNEGDPGIDSSQDVLSNPFRSCGPHDHQHKVKRHNKFVDLYKCCR